jgi:hypothetical protein
MAALFRILFLAPIGFILASVAAGAVVVFALLYRLTPVPDGPELVALVAGAAMASAFVAAVPALLAVILAEAFGWRSLFHWLAVGGLIAAMVVATPYFAGQMQLVAGMVLLIAWVPHVTEVDGSSPTSFATVAFAAGFVGGFVYWLVAGRFAGYSDVTSRA